MRFRLLCAGALAAGLAAAAPASAMNPQHAGLQVALRAQGLYLGPIDAIIGPHTLAAVREFQRTHGLRATRLADARTRPELRPLGTPLFGSRKLQHGRVGLGFSWQQVPPRKHSIPLPDIAYLCHT